MESLIDQIEFVDKASPPPLLLPSMGSMMKGKIFVENLMRENSLKGLFGLKKDELTWEEEEAEAEPGGFYHCLPLTLYIYIHVHICTYFISEPKLHGLGSKFKLHSLPLTLYIMYTHTYYVHTYIHTFH